MREIRIDCFKDNQECQIISEQKNFQVSEAKDQEYLLAIQNFLDQDCQLSILVNKQNQDQNQAQNTSLLIKKDQQIVFHDQLNSFFSQNIDLGNISKQSTQNYTFYFDVSKLAFSREKLAINFDLNLSFSCQEPEETIFVEEQVKTQTNSAVLGTTTETKPDNKIFFAVTLFCLFVFLFFVIMKLINGKKKKK